MELKLNQFNLIGFSSEAEVKDFFSKKTQSGADKNIKKHLTEIRDDVIEFIKNDYPQVIFLFILKNGKNSFTSYIGAIDIKKIQVFIQGLK